METYFSSLITRSSLEFVDVPTDKTYFDGYNNKPQTSKRTAPCR